MGKPRRETHLMLRWSKKERDLLYSYPTSPPDGHLLHAAFTRPLFDGKMPSFVDELKARGYDIETIRFSIAKKPRPAGLLVGEGSHDSLQALRFVPALDERPLVRAHPQEDPMSKPENLRASADARGRTKCFSGCGTSVEQVAWLQARMLPCPFCGGDGANLVVHLPRVAGGRWAARIGRSGAVT